MTTFFMFGGMGGRLLYVFAVNSVYNFGTTELLTVFNDV